MTYLPVGHPQRDDTVKVYIVTWSPGGSECMIIMVRDTYKKCVDYIEAEKYGDPTATKEDHNIEEWEVK